MNYILKRYYDRINTNNEKKVANRQKIRNIRKIKYCGLYKKLESFLVKE